MSLRLRLSAFLTTIVAAAALVAAGVEPAIPQAANDKGAQGVPDKGAQMLGVFGPAALQGQEIIFRSPQFKVEALWFKVNDETGWYWTGSDEVYAIFSDMDATHTDRTTAEYEADEGDTINFSAEDRCMAAQPNCDRGMADLNVAFSFWEADWAAPLYFSYCNKPDSPGVRWRLDLGICIDDDFIGRGSIIYSRDELVAMLPAVGDSREFTAVMDKDAGKYRFRYRITRLPNTERSIVIHIPPVVVNPTITLQAIPILVSGQKAVRLLWGGTTTTSIDIYRDGTKILTTPNDGAHNDLVPSGTYQYRVCDLNSTTACSSDVTAVVN